MLGVDVGDRVGHPDEEDDGHVVDVLARELVAVVWFPTSRRTRHLLLAYMSPDLGDVYVLADFSKLA